MSLFFGLFIWGSVIYVRQFQPPANALKIYVVAKQWMWKIEHAGGQREINALHVPIDTPVELVMTSEDVIHDFFVPAFRVKRDVLPGQYETLWFRADRVGTYHLFCSQFCGTDHANMIGDVVVMPAKAYADWLTSNGAGDTLADQGKGLFIRYGCAGCHLGGGTVRAPSLAGLYGSPVPLSDGSTVIADDRYIRELDHVSRSSRSSPVSSRSCRPSPTSSPRTTLCGLSPTSIPWPRRSTDEPDRPAAIPDQLSVRRRFVAELAADHRPQADRDPVHDLDHGVLLPRRIGGGADPLQPDRARKA